jgi:alpha-beta hydrolase superfamily lysophospholipase
MGSTNKPSILLVPGSFALPEFYDPVFDIVRSKGYDIKGLHKPSVGLSAGQPRPGPLPTMYDDAAHIAKEVEKLVDEGKDVILVPHSYGGVPASQSTKGLSKAERQQAGKPGGIVNIAYLTCLVPAIGQTAKDVLATVDPGTQIQLTVKVSTTLNLLAFLFGMLTFLWNRTMAGCTTNHRSRRRSCLSRTFHWRKAWRGSSASLRIPLPALSMN